MSRPEDPPLRVDVAGGVATVTIDRPAARNAYSYAVERAWHDALDAADADPDIRCVVLTATGDAFCPGFDPEAMAAAVVHGADTAGRSDRPFHHAVTRSVPVIGAINGACAGVGLALALTCDIRVAAAEARFSTAFAPLGLPAERGSSWLLPRIVGHSRALELMLTARSFDAAEARAIGLVHDVTPRADLPRHAAALAARLVARGSPAALATIKRQLYRDWTVALRESTRQANADLELLVAGPDFRRAMRARADGTYADFTPSTRPQEDS